MSLGGDNGAVSAKVETLGKAAFGESTGPDGPRHLPRRLQRQRLIRSDGPNPARTLPGGVFV